MMESAPWSNRRAKHSTLSGPSSQTVTVDYATSNGTAVAPADYASTSGTLTFDPGVTSRTVEVAVAGLFESKGLRDD